MSRQKPCAVSNYVIETVNLTKTYNTRGMRIRAVDNINLGFMQGEFTAIMGSSGSPLEKSIQILVRSLLSFYLN